jgi:FkbM family methyltransferase
MGCRHVLAVEAMPETYSKLAENVRRNGNKIRTSNKATYSKSGDMLHIGQDAESHAGASLRKNGHPVEVLAIDNMVAHGGLPDDIPIIVKLDVGGVEIAALGGMRESLNRDVIIICGDHAQDSGSNVTRYILHVLKMNVYCVSEDGHLLDAGSERQAPALKVGRHKGYIFFVGLVKFPLNAIFDASTTTIRKRN